MGGVAVAIWTFGIVMLLMTASGALSVVKKRKTTDDYLVASRSVPAWLTALSTVGTNNSGFMFIGMIAYTYRLGIQAIWMMLGWLLGDFLAWIFVHPRVQEISEEYRVSTLSGVLGYDENTAGRARTRLLSLMAAWVTLVFLTVYAAAQLKAGSTALHALFGWKMYVGALIGAGIVLLYSYAGGIRADIWTDAAQSFVMLASMVAIVVAAWAQVGDPLTLFDRLRGVDPALMKLVPEGLSFGLPGFVLGFVFAGMGVVGQPHLMSRLMAIESKEAIVPARRYYFLWFIPFWTASVLVGLYSRVVLPDLTSSPIGEGMTEPTELALPLMTMELLPQVFIGAALAGLFAATISTADSQIIVCSGAITNDIRPKWRDSYLASKLGTFFVLCIALGIAMFAPEGVFVLVLVAWSVLGASLGAPLIVRAFRLSLPRSWGVAMMAIGIVVVVAWQAIGWDDDVFKLLPGMLAAFLVYGAYLLTRRWRSIRGRS